MLPSVSHAGHFLMSQLVLARLKPTILWLGVRRANYSAIATRRDVDCFRGMQTIYAAIFPCAIAPACTMYTCLSVFTPVQSPGDGRGHYHNVRGPSRYQQHPRQPLNASV